MKEILTTLVQVVVIPAIPVLVTYLVKYLKAKAEQTTTKINNELVRTYLQEATDAVLQAVTYTAHNTAKDIALKLLTDEAKQMIEDLYGDLMLWLETKIEQNRRGQQSKNRRPSPWECWSQSQQRNNTDKDRRVFIVSGGLFLLTINQRRFIMFSNNENWSGDNDKEN